MQIQTGAAGTDINLDSCFIRLPTPWVYIQDWDLWTNTEATWTSSDGSETLSDLILGQDFGAATGSIYKVTFTIAGYSLTGPSDRIRVRIAVGGLCGLGSNGTYVCYLTAGATESAGLQFFAQNVDAGDTFTLSNVIVELTTPGTSTDTLEITGNLRICSPNFRVGPTGTYVRTATVLNGRNVWQSVENHPHCADGNLVPWYLWFDTTRWVLSETQGSYDANAWQQTSTAETPTDLDMDPNTDNSGDAGIFNQPETIPPLYLIGR